MAQVHVEPGAPRYKLYVMLNCFSLTAAERQAIAAQVRRNGAILQHGSVPIHIDPEEHLAVMPGDGVDEASKAKLMEAFFGTADWMRNTQS